MNKVTLPNGIRPRCRWECRFSVNQQSWERTEINFTKLRPSTFWVQLSRKCVCAWCVTVSGSFRKGNICKILINLHTVPTSCCNQCWSDKYDVAVAYFCPLHAKWHWLYSWHAIATYTHFNMRDIMLTMPLEWLCIVVMVSVVSVSNNELYNISKKYSNWLSIEPA